MVKNWETEIWTWEIKGRDNGTENEHAMLWEESGPCVHHAEGLESFAELWVSFLKVSIYVHEYFTCMCMPGVHVVQRDC